MIAQSKEFLRNLINPEGRFVVEHYRKGRLIGKYAMPNGITNEGKDLLLDVMFNDATQIANNSWFIGLIDNAGGPSVDPTDTMPSHGGWSEFTAFSEGTRVAWGSGAASAQSTTNSTPATFNITGAAATVFGVFIPTNSTKGGTTGDLWATAAFSVPVPVTGGDQLKITYTVSS